MSDPPGGRAIFRGFVYGDSTGTTLVACQTRDQDVSFTRQPNVTTAVNAFLSLANVTEPISKLTSGEIADLFGNRIIGPAGPVFELDQYQIQLTSRGFIGESYPYGGQTNATILGAGNAYFVGVGLRAGQTISNLYLIVNTAAAALTVSLVGLYDKTGTRLAVSADQGASWQTTGLKTIPIGPVTIPTTDVYFIGIFAAGGTLPVVTRGSASTAAIPQFSIGGKPAWGYVQTGQATLPSPATFADSGTATVVPFYWFGFS